MHKNLHTVYYIFQIISANHDIYELGRTVIIPHSNINIQFIVYHIHTLQYLQ
jgi:hypothetical protein